MGQILDFIKRTYEHTFHKAQFVAGHCSAPTLEQVKDLLEHGSSLTEKAKRTTAFAKYSGILGTAGDKLDGAAESINDLMKRGSSAAGDMSAACEISEAISVLNQWNTSGGSASNQDAAKAFDQLFGGTARFFSKLPPPANVYANIFSEIAKNNFFSRMQDLMDPESPNTPSGRMMRDIMNNNY
jgi:hypothetical protein